MSSSFRDLRVWQEAMRLVYEVYRETADFPKHEIYGLTQQMRRAAVSVPSNIAEGKGHRSDKEFRHFLFHAPGMAVNSAGSCHLCRTGHRVPRIKPHRFMRQEWRSIQVA